MIFNSTRISEATFASQSHSQLFFEDLRNLSRKQQPHLRTKRFATGFLKASSLWKPLVEYTA